MDFARVLGTLRQTLDDHGCRYAVAGVLAMKNDPVRAFRELGDIRHLISVAGADRDAVREQFVRHGLEERYRELEASL